VWCQDINWLNLCLFSCANSPFHFRHLWSLHRSGPNCHIIQSEFSEKAAIVVVQQTDPISW
jgi:hypothetical protein